MADAAYIQDKIYYGYGKAAIRLGLLCDVFHSLSPINPLDVSNNIGQILAAFTETWNYMKPESYGKPGWLLIADGRSTPESIGFVTGDYFVNAGFTYFLASKRSLQPLFAIECNTIITIIRATQDNQPGFNGAYAGFVPSEATILASQLPASLLVQSIGRENHQKLPTDTLLPRWIMLIPNLGNVIYKNRDIVSDATGKRYVIASAELSDLGWRIGLELLGV